MSKVIKVEGQGVAVVGNDIDTDRIIPARYLKEITFSRMGYYPFIDDMKSDPSHPFNKYKGLDRNRRPHILFANVNFGCGSSREHAPQALYRWGIEAVVAESLAEIFAGNCVMLGLPAVTASKEDIAKIQEAYSNGPERKWSLDLNAMELRSSAWKFIPNAEDTEPPIATFAPAEEIIIKVQMPDSRRKALMEGTWDSTGILQANADKVAELIGKLPYIKNFA